MFALSLIACGACRAVYAESENADNPRYIMIGAGYALAASAFSGIGLVLSTWIYFCLNYAFFHFPWPWAEWTGRTPNGVIFTVCAVGLTLAALSGRAKITSHL